MSSRAILNWLAWAACILAVFGLLYVSTAPPIILAHYHRTGDGGIPSFYDPLMDLAFSDFGAPVIWYFNSVWHADLSAIGQMPEFGWLVTPVDILVGALVVGMIGVPFIRLIRRRSHAA
jgi:hypothetical protein